MNRVTLINLAGRALYVEDEGVEAIDSWMKAARATLEGDPDRDELLVDFEQAIADRCATHTGTATDVITTRAVEEMLSALRSAQSCASGERRGRVTAMLIDSDSMEYARDAARGHIAAAVGSLADLPVSDARSSLIAMAEFVLSRRA